MRVFIENLGSIKRAEITLKPLTVFVGPNNAGKTWTAYMLSAIFNDYGWIQYMFNLQSEPDDDAKIKIILDALVTQILEEGSAKINLVDFVREWAEPYINGVCNLASSWMNDAFKTDFTDFKSLQVRIVLDDFAEVLVNRIRNLEISRRLSVTNTRSLLTASKKAKTNDLFFYTSSREQLVEKLPREAVEEIVFTNVLYSLHRAFYRNTYPFPTERTTMVSIPFVIRRVDIVDKDLVGDEEDDDKEMGSTRMATLIISVFMNMMSRARQIRLSNRQRTAEKNRSIYTYMDLAALLEERILKGKVLFSSQEPILEKDLLFELPDKSHLEMPITSSMVKELSPLVLYLRYIARPSDWLIIDEPEMNLHPEAQAQLIELLTMLAQSGISVLITTHSPYMVDHLANLIKAASAENKESIESKFFLGTKEAFISKEKVSVHLFEEGSTKQLLDQDGLINWETFGDISSRISQLYFDI